MPIANNTENIICVMYAFFRVENKNNGNVQIKTQNVFKLTAEKIFRSAIMPNNIRKGILMIPLKKYKKYEHI
jgi:hypothetical protein